MFFFSRELLFSFDSYCVSRETLQTLSDGEIENVILDIWALRLSSCDLKDQLGNQKEFFSLLMYL